MLSRLARLVSEILFEAAFVFVQDDVGGSGIRGRHIPGGLGPSEESSYRVGFTARLTFGLNRLACFSQANIRHVHGELAAPRAIKQFCRRLRFFRSSAGALHAHRHW